MVKLESIGMYDVAKINPVLTSVSDVKNYSFITVGGITYLVLNDINGDDSYKEGIVIKAGDFLNGYDISAWIGQKLVIDGKHITGGVSGLTAGTSTLVLDGDHAGMLKTGAGSAGDYVFKVTEKVTRTEAAVKVQITVKPGE